MLRCLRIEQNDVDVVMKFRGGSALGLAAIAKASHASAFDPQAAAAWPVALSSA